MIDPTPPPGLPSRWARVTRSIGSVIGVAVLVLATAAPAQAAPSPDRQWHLDYLKVAQAHQITKGGGVTVAVVDSGVDATHPDLAGAVLPGRDLSIIPDDPPDGRVDANGHGTAMAGLIAGRGRVGTGVLGVAPEARILPLRTHSQEEYISSDTHTAIRWAAKQQVGVISMSFSEKDYPDLAAAIEAARRMDVVLVASAGNRPKESAVGYPAAYPGVITVGGVDERGNHAEVSVTGSEIDIVAPAQDLPVAYTNHQYLTAPGTSAAAAIVSGAAALVRAKYPELSAAEVAYRLTATAVDKGAPGRDPVYGHGVLDIVAALTADLPPMPADAAEPLPTPTFTRPGPPPNALDEDRALPGGLLIIGLVVGLLVVALIAGSVWYLVRRRSSINA